MTITVGVLTEGTASSSFLRVLPRMFGQRNVMQMGVSDLSDRKKTSGLAMLVLPGIEGEVSPYPGILQGAAGKAIIDHVQSGGILWTSCAPTYALCATTEYHASNGTVKTREGLGLIQADAIGPVDREDAIAPRRADRFADVRCVPVTFTAPDSQKTPMRAHLPYGNGPALHLREGEDAEILARFGSEYGKGPAAIVLKRVEKGIVIASGILAELGLEETRAFAGNGQKFAHAARMERELAPNENRRKMLTGQIRMICQHHRRFVKS